MKVQYPQKLLVYLTTLAIVGFAPATFFADALVNFLLWQTTDFVGPLADCTTTTHQNIGNIAPPTILNLQRLHTRIATPIFFIQTVVKASHSFFCFTIVEPLFFFLVCLVFHPGRLLPAALFINPIGLTQEPYG